MSIIQKIGRLSFLMAVLALIFSTDCFAQKRKKKKKKKKEETEQVAPTPVEVETNDMGCPMYGPDKQQTLMTYSLYKESFKQGDYSTALPYWRVIFKEAPGLRKSTYIDGEKMFSKLLEETQDEAQKGAYFDTINQVYDKREKCYGESNRLDNYRLKLFRKTYPDNKEELFEMYDSTIEKVGDDAEHSFLVPYFSMWVKKYQNQEATPDQVMEQYDRLMKIAENNVTKENKADKFSKAMEQMENTKNSILNLEEKNAVNDCQSAKEYYGKDYNADPNDLNNVKKMYQQLKKYKCYDDPLFLEVAKKLNKAEPNASRSLLIAKKLKKAGDLAQSKVYFQQAFDLEDEVIKKYDIKMELARMAHYKEKDYAAARSLYLEAAALNPSAGKPYLQIGTLYASSGKKCGPGTGWESQKVIWPAMDKWQKAKQLDPSLEEEAQKLINKYWGYLPTKKEAFLKDVKSGQGYFVGCWIQENTTVRLK